MASLDADAIRQFASQSAQRRIANVEVFSEIDSTNSYLMQMPGPAAGEISIAVTSNQTAGRGRHGKTWLAPQGSGLCLSIAYTFSTTPDNLPALTLALGLGAIDALEEIGASGVELKWPNDLVANDGKLGGILTEVQQQSAGGVTVVTGIGLNVDLPDTLDFETGTDWARKVVDLKNICVEVPRYDEVAAKLASHLLQAFDCFEQSGFAEFAERWTKYDWLHGREITVEIVGQQFSGIGAGIAEDGALLVETPESGMRRVTSGTIVIARPRQEA